MLQNSSTATKGERNVRLRLGGGGAREILFRCEVEPQRMRASVDPVKARHVAGTLG